MSRPTSVTLVEVRCSGCGRKLAFGTGPPMHKMTCSAWCSYDDPVTENEERDSIIEMLARTQGWTPTQVAVNFELTRQRVTQILRRRGVIT